MPKLVDHSTKLNLFDLQEIGKSGHHDLGCTPGAAMETCHTRGPVHEKFPSVMLAWCFVDVEWIAKRRRRQRRGSVSTACVECERKHTRDSIVTAGDGIQRIDAPRETIRHSGRCSHRRAVLRHCCCKHLSRPRLGLSWRRCQRNESQEFVLIDGVAADAERLRTYAQCWRDDHDAQQSDIIDQHRPFNQLKTIDHVD